MSKEYTPKLPKCGKVFCIICREEITAPPFIASKRRGEPTIYAHTECFTKEQQDWGEEEARRERDHT